MYRVLALALLLSVIGIPLMAYADPPDVDELSDLQSAYIGIGFTDTGPVWDDEGVTVALTEGEVQFTINISETYPGDVDNCWVYFDGDVYSGTSVYLTADTFREHYGAVAIECDDDALEYAAFTVHPYWDDIEDVTFSATAPPPSTWIMLPEDVETVFLDVNGIEPDGAPTGGYIGRCFGKGESALCKKKVVNLPPECNNDSDCRNES